MNDKESDIVFDYLYDLDKVMDISDALKECNIKITEDNIYEIGDLAYDTGNFAIDNNKLIPKCIIFKDISFRIIPTEREINDGILILGHRIVPFYYADNDIDSFSLMYNGNELEQKTIKMNYNDFDIHYNLLDTENIPYLSDIDPMDFGKDPKNITIKVEAYNVKDFYTKTGFKSGDSIIVKINDFFEGVYDISADKNPDLEKIKQSDKELVNNIKESIDIDFEFPSIETQLLNAVYLSKELFLKTPPSPFGKILSNDKELTFSTLPTGDKLIHLQGQDLSEYLPDFNDIMMQNEEKFNNTDPDTLETIDEIFEYLGSNYSMGHIEAVIIDQLAFGEFNYDSLYKYIFKNKENPFFDDKKLEEKFKLIVITESNRIKKLYEKNPPPLPANTLRKKLLKHIQMITDFLRDIDSFVEDIEELPMDEMMELNSLNVNLDSILFSLNLDKSITPADIKELNQIESFINKMEEILPVLFRNIKSKLE